ncbi:MAG TPA: AAA family ATPase [Steroidobacteraceae bacterium]|jgi:type II secretory pathway predicted ATPase ExeA|nr:AAA family ATPase [Steroidobacteraceae bacterium]
MYLELFKLHELPFRLSPDPQFLYLSKQHARAKAYMESTIWFTDGFVVITGEIGAGKTTLIETFLRELQSDVIVAQINQTQLSPTAFLQTVLVQFGFSPFNMKKPEVLATLNQFLMEQHVSGRKVLLIVDEAQNLTNRVLEEVRMLSGVETTKEKALRIILAGQPELNEKLNSQDLIQLSQRVRLRFHLTALTKAETNAYIDHRLEVAGSQGRRIFAEDIYATIYKYTGGVPRLINTLCDTCLMAAYGKDKDSVTGVELEAAIQELQWVEFASGTNRMKALNMEHTIPPNTDSSHVVGRILLAIDGKTVVERELKPGRLVIGRTPDNDLQIDSKFISRHHCQLVTQQDSCLIEDLNSTNGIFVKSKRVRRHNLNDGDVVQVGQHEIMYIDERSPRVRSSLDPVDTGVVTGVVETPKLG